MSQEQLLQNAANAIRVLSVDAIVKAGEGHQGVPLGMAEIATVLYLNHLKHNPQDPLWCNRDRVVLSNGHGSMLLYSLLYLSGYERISLDQIRSFRELDSICAGHPEIDTEAGIELTTGQLGQGIANAMGMAVAEAFLRQHFGQELISHFTYAFVGDGCLQEGIGQEMISLAGHLGLSKLILLMDDNAITDDGSTDISISEDVSKRFEIAHWHVQQIDGHDIAAIDNAITSARDDSRPSVIMARTIIAKGLSRLQGLRGGHSAKIFEDDAQKMRTDLNWFYPSFFIPKAIINTWRNASKKSQFEYATYKSKVANLPQPVFQEFERVMTGVLPSELLKSLDNLKNTLHNEPPQGGINISAAINDALTEFLPERLVACADLEAPTDHKRKLNAFTAKNHRGSYIHCGVREHLMGSMANGMSAHGGVIPVCVTYLAFSDYMRPSMRMAALMRLPVKFVFSHDSIGLGKNGPTHQPVEILASLRAMPHMLVMRPADAVEASECWQKALTYQDGPISLIFARQVLPHVRQTVSSENLSAKGAYVLSHESITPRRVTILATGSEVAIALKAKEKLELMGVSTAVVSMPCWELFEQQSEEYRSSVLCSSSVKVGVEAAVKMGWERYLGEHGRFVGMSDFGCSGSSEALYKHFEITDQKVVNEALDMLDVIK